jgi:hypothetical protein
MLNVRRKRRVAIGLAVTVLLIAELVAWRPSHTAGMPTVPTGASFNLSVARFDNHRQARLVAADIEASGLPAFTRAIRNATLREVIVGPYVSIDEAEAAQRVLRRRGFGRARLLVDESVRRITAEAVATGYSVGAMLNTGLVAVSAAGRVSVVLELPVEPRTITMRRTAGNVLEVDAGPIVAEIVREDSGRQEWIAPDGVELFQRVSVEAAGANKRLIRTRVTVPPLVQARVRTAATRVYIDLWSPQSIDDMPMQVHRSTPVIVDDEDDEAIPAATSVESYREALRPTVVRFTEIQPFLLAAVASPSPEVMTALARTLKGLAEWARAIVPPQPSAATHASLVAAVDLAAGSLDPVFEGDRVAQARQAVALFTIASTQLLPAATLDR